MKYDTFVLHGVVWKPRERIRSSEYNAREMECDRHVKIPPPEILSDEQIKKIRIEWCDSLDLAATLMMLAHLPNLSELHLKNCSIQTVPPEIRALYKLKKLSFGNDTYGSNNEFETFPPEIGFLDNLRELDLCANRKFKRFPPEAAKMRDLEYINLRELYGLPENIELIPNLKRLRLVKSRIRWANIEPLVNRPNGLESATVDDYLYNAFKKHAEKYPNFSVSSEDSGHSSRGSYL